jgi:hypothetical protein
MAKKKAFRIEGVNIALDDLKEANHTDASIKETGIFSHLPEGKQAAAYQALKAQLDAHAATPTTVTVEKGASVKNFTAEAPATETAKVSKSK